MPNELAKTVEEAIRRFVDKETPKVVNDEELIFESGYLKDAIVENATQYSITLRKGGYRFYLSVITDWGQGMLHISSVEKV